MALIAEARDGAGDVGHVEDVAEGNSGEVFDRVAEAGFELGEFGFEGEEVFGFEAFLASPVVSFIEGGWVVRVELVEQQALGEGAEGDEGHSLFGHEVGDSGAGADELVVEGVGPALEALGLDFGGDSLEVVGGVGGLAFDADFAFFDESVHGFHGVIKIEITVAERAVVEVVDVYVIAFEVDERLLALVTDVGGLVGVGGSSGEVAELGGDDVVGGIQAEFVEGSGEHSLGFSVAVDVGVIEVIDSSVDAGFDGSDDFGFVDVCPAVGGSVDPVESAHGPAAEADF